VYVLECVSILFCRLADRLLQGREEFPLHAVYRVS
jgi:hypothetical protein